MWPVLIPLLGQLLDKAIPDKGKAEEAKLELLKMQMNGDLQQTLGQLEINKEEAKNANLFVSGWRPSVGWVCSLGLVYEFLVRSIAGGFGYSFPPIDTNALNSLLFALLGVAGLRTVEKVKGVA
jgi:hypothetical protein